MAPKVPRNYGNPRTTTVKKSNAKLPLGNTEVTNSTSLSNITGAARNAAQNDVIVEFDPLTESQRDILLPQQDNFLDSL